MTAAVALIGPGRVGCALTKRLVAAGYPIHAVIGRASQPTKDACSFIGCAASCATTDLKQAAGADIILLAVPDDRIAAVAKTTAAAMSLDDKFLVHFSGLLPSSILLAAAPEPDRLLSLHPLLAFADRTQAYASLSGCPCALEGGSAGVLLGHQLVATFAGAPFEIAAADKPLYHTAASMASNFMVTLQSMAQNLLRQCGIPQDKLAATLMPLVQATLSNLTTLPAEKALTGPIVRGDSGTVAQHLATLTARSPETLSTYLPLARVTLDLATRSGRLHPDKALELAKLLQRDPPD